MTTAAPAERLCCCSPSTVSCSGLSTQRCFTSYTDGVYCSYYSALNALGNSSTAGLKNLFPPPPPPTAAAGRKTRLHFSSDTGRLLSQIASSLPLPVISFAVSDILKPTRLGRTAGKFLMYRRVTLSFNGISLQDFLPLLCHRLIL